MRAKLFSVNKRTFIHGLFMAIGGALAGTLQEWVSTGNIPTSVPELIPAIKLASGAAVTYLIKELVSNSNGDLMAKEPKSST